VIANQISTVVGALIGWFRERQMADDIVSHFFVLMANMSYKKMPADIAYQA
jgi:hypothetical protein